MSDGWGEGAALFETPKKRQPANVRRRRCGVEMIYFVAPAEDEPVACSNKIRNRPPLYCQIWQ